MPQSLFLWFPANCIVDAQQWESHGAAKPIYKPFAQTRFLQPVVARQERGQKREVDRVSSTELPKRDLRVLICEDNTVNQMFAKEICRKANIQVVVSDNGQAGIEVLLQDTNFDAIFMDCQMPIMDGFQAARKIREMTNQGSIPKIPVIALTANALASDREKCLESGMDDYLTKPFEIGDFLGKLNAHTSTPANVDHANSSQTQSDTLVFDIDKLVSQFNDRDFALQIAEHFASTFPGHQADLRKCLKQQDPQQALSVAHRLKGSAATVSADRISKIAVEIELAARECQLEQIQTQLGELLSEFENFANAVRDESTARQ